MTREGSRFSFSQLEEKLSYRSKKMECIEDYKSYFGGKTIWFCTILSVGIHHIPKQFDVVIMDEASQCLEPICLSIMQKCSKFILVGDYKQLQPIVKN